MVVCAESRGTLNCNLFNTFLGNVPGAAHCLRFDPLYYQVNVCQTTDYTELGESLQLMVGM